MTVTDKDKQTVRENIASGHGKKVAMFFLFLMSFLLFRKLMTVISSAGYQTLAGMVKPFCLHMRKCKCK
jgi:hypothetical protein